MVGEAVLASRNGKLKAGFTLDDVQYTIIFMPMFHCDPGLKDKLNKCIFKQL